MIRDQTLSDFDERYISGLDIRVVRGDSPVMDHILGDFEGGTIVSQIESTTGYHVHTWNPWDGYICAWQFPLSWTTCWLPLWSWKVDVFGCSELLDDQFLRYMCPVDVGVCWPVTQSGLRRPYQSLGSGLFASCVGVGLQGAGKILPASSDGMPALTQHGYGCIFGMLLFDCPCELCAASFSLSASRC